MREILFRGRRTDGGGWAVGSLIKAENFCCILDEDEAESMDYPYLDSEMGWIDGKVTPVIPETIGQFTGLTDKNGKKIFEGDILRIGYCFGWDSEQEKKVPEEEYISKVYSIDCCPFCVDLQHCDGDMSPVAWLDWSYDDVEIEVIGNIHYNPELLIGGADND